MKKFVLLLILILIIATTFVIKLQKTSANWETYTNTEYGFTFKYPTSLIISSTPDSISLISTNSCVAEYQKPYPGDNYVPTGCYSISILVQENKVTHESINTTKTSPMVNGIQTEKTVTDNGGYFEIISQTKKDSSWYIITGSSNTLDKELLENVVNEIISSFKFTTKN